MPPKYEKLDQIEHIHKRSDMYVGSLKPKREENEWISVSRKYNQYYRVDGNDGDKKISVAKNIFPQNIVDFISKEVNI